MMAPKSVEAGGGGRAGAAAQERLHALQQLQHAEGLGDVVVGAQPEPQHLVGLLVARRQDQHRHVEPLGAQRPQHAVAVEVGQHQVEHHEVGAPAARHGQSRAARVAHLDLVAGDLEVVAQAEREVLVVLDDQDAAHAVAASGGGA
jgi:hypothetical protein